MHLFVTWTPTKRGMALYQEVSSLLVILQVYYPYLTTVVYCVTVNDKKQPTQMVAVAVAPNTVGEKKKTSRGRCTPYKAKDLVPLVRAAVSKNPSLLNKDMESLLAPYGKTGATVSVFTDSLLQNTRKEARTDVFGSPETNATYAMALKVELQKKGHGVHVGYGT